MTEGANISQVNNRRIAKNTVMLYFRMFLTMVVGLYTSRVVLRTLGVEDYGIYGVVGGVVGMLGFLNASMSGATSRFLTFELGLGHMERLKKTFSSALIVHCIVALIVFVIAETAGLWFLNHKLVIPEGRMHAARVVYQLSILSTMIGITQVPYNANIIAHEKMDVYAYVEILNVSLKLGIVFLLVIGNFDKLILYSILTFAVSVIVMMVYRIYCIRKFDECHFHWIWDREYLKPLLSFSGWDLYGNVCGTIKAQGNIMLLNMFFGPVANTGASIANTVIGTLSALSSNVITAFRPQIVKQYAIRNLPAMITMVNRAVIFSSLLLSFIAFPLVAEMPFVLHLWLGQVPEYSVTLSQIAVFNSFFANINMVMLIGLQATGDISRVSFWGGSIYLLNVIVAYLLLKYCGLGAYWVFGLNCIFMGGVLMADIILFKKQIPNSNMMRFTTRILIPIIIIAGMLFLLGRFITGFSSQGWLRLLYQFGILSVASFATYYTLVFSSEDRRFLLNIIRSMKHRVFN